VRNVILDLGGVVFEWDPDAILEGYYADPGARGPMKAALFQHPDWLRMDRGDLSEAEVLARLEQRTGLPNAELVGLFEAIRASLRPKADTLALLEHLVRREVPLYCLSNMSATTFTHLRERHAFFSMFKGIVISGQINLMKPEPEIFEHVLREYALVRDQTIFVDDHPANIEAARTLGLHAVLFSDARQCESDLNPLLVAA
jgi:putative hydrolase of the HAD superfamily